MKGTFPSPQMVLRYAEFNQLEDYILKNNLTVEDIVLIMDSYYKEYITELEGELDEYRK